MEHIHWSGSWTINGVTTNQVTTNQVTMGTDGPDSWEYRASRDAGGTLQWQELRAPTPTELEARYPQGRRALAQKIMWTAGIGSLVCFVLGACLLFRAGSRHEQNRAVYIMAMAVPLEVVWFANAGYVRLSDPRRRDFYPVIDFTGARGKVSALIDAVQRSEGGQLDSLAIPMREILGSIEAGVDEGKGVDSEIPQPGVEGDPIH